MSLITEYLAHHARQQPEATALRGARQHLSYRQLDDQVSVLADELAALDCCHLAIWMDNSPQWALLQLAAMKAGLCITLIPATFGPAAVEALFQQIGIELLFVSRPAQLNRLAGAPLSLPQTAQHNPELALSGFRLAPQAGAHKVAPDTRLISFTAGTGGTPKGVCLSADLIDQVCRSLLDATDPIAIGQQLCLQPLSVLTENIVSLLVPLCAGISIRIASREESGQSDGVPDVAQLARLLQSEQPHGLNLTPELLKALIGVRMLYGPLPSLKFVLVSGGKVAAGMLEKAQQLQLPVYEGYGLNECGALVSLNLPGKSLTGSVGRVLPHCRLLLSAEGEIRVTGASMLGYLGGGSSPACIDTGDSGFINVDGYLFISGRQDEIQTNSRGRHFSPEWIEAELNNLSTVAQVCVFGDNSDFISAVIQPENNATIARIQLQLDQLNEQLPESARIEQWFLADGPFSVANDQLTAAGQVRREAVYRYYGPQLNALYRQTNSSETLEKHHNEEIVSALTGFGGLGPQPA
ncbi:AMP-binding protein [Marinobacterium jannaschii]|uniref:AMP-binding protein n=1 Tax=Marinobacterium jannaschii TaxID=64970 RepID=UPI000687A9FC|nr:AMP-binding protein [Marinobacterium jannaschii]